MGRRLGQPDGPLLVSVRSGAKFSMPGMMETVLNVGLNDESVKGLAAMTDGDERFAYDSYRRLLQMFGSTVLGIEASAFADALDRLKDDARRDERRRPRRRGPDRARRDVQAAHRRAHRPRVPAGPARADGPGRPGGLRLLEHRAGGALPPPGADPRRPRHGRQHLLDGVRQRRRRLRHRRRLHPRPGVRRAGHLRRLPAERAGRGRGRRHPQHRAAGRPREDRQDVVRRAAGHHADARGALPRPVRHRVHHRARQALDAADPGRQAHRGGGLPDRLPARRPGPDRHGRGGAAGSPAPSSRS